MKKNKELVEDYIGYIQTRGELKKYSEGIESNIWFNGNGEEILISDMSVNHINSCIYFITHGRNPRGTMIAPKQLMKYSQKYIKLFKKELLKR